MDAEFVNDPVNRGSELDASQLILSRNFPFLQFGDTALDLAQLFLRVGVPVLIDADDLQPRFRDLADNLGDLRDQRSDLTLDAGLVALQAETPSPAANLLVEFDHLRQLVTDQGGFAGLGRILQRQPFDLVLVLLDPFAELRLLAARRCESRQDKRRSPLATRSASGLDAMKPGGNSRSS